jgi:hypothetical protein
MPSFCLMEVVDNYGVSIEEEGAVFQNEIRGQHRLPCDLCLVSSHCEMLLLSGGVTWQRLK